ncbi:methyltransferase domain-containing protein [Maribellus comscasis]|uniref:Methyltransferase domain-containing protein n=1 Tax=Maribellus comscasis TaxID=2681766 RepID=A0A6I6JS80_9BACT|nr:class I SAM-dependent methyltransferase [Maribellus comscasis]QGY43928.1 methyltransferase domain-containing protein [Maribellus comscasis]
MKCLNCNSTRAENFYLIKDAPVQSIVTIKSFEEAVAIPKKDITLAFCKECGFVFNSTFDTTIDHYTKGYEDQQGFSPTFTKFINDFTQRFIDKYDIYGKDVIEVGCGKGDFLNLICKLGNNRGIGIDPAYVPGRSEPNPNIRFIKEFYSEKHGDLPADVIVCRHTLEHIHDTGNFLSTIRNSIKNNKEVVVLFEVPSIVRILKINAFWDIFYEHCSYFSAGSLGRLFRLNGFEIIDIYVEYDDQYLFIEAKPSNEKVVGNTHPKEEAVHELKQLVDQFVVNINNQLEEWEKRLLMQKDEGKKVVMWGGGSKAVGFLTHFNKLNVIEHVVDINPHIQGNFIPGIGIQYKNPEFLKEYVPDTVIIMNGIYRNEIRDSLSNMGLAPEIICM